MEEARGIKKIVDIYGENVFSLKTMRNYLSDKAYKSLRSTIKEGKSLNNEIADEVADAMKTWAVSKGATHFTHWFQPLTGTTAEKHDSFIVPDQEGGVVLKFSGEELIKGEPDASSFPSGGLRATFEARGYTAWDPTSPAFIKEGKNGATLCIPTAFYSYHGEVLDKKTPLLRSINAISKQLSRLGKIFGIQNDQSRHHVTLGVEQEYFLIDKELYVKRLDLMQTGRTLFGIKPAKHQQMSDHYFGAIKSRVMVFMEDLDWELWRLGIPAKTRHNEVCPAQFEIAPVYEEQNLSVDHNMMIMEALKQTAEKHNFVCLLHEKPYAGVNGSGKHNNWSICGSDGKNWLSPGDNPHENAKFLTIICALIKAVDEYAGLLRASIASSGNDHRLGANEAPPAIMSIFLGEQLADVISQIEKGGAKSSKKSKVIQIGVTSLPPLPRDVTDRNRTSPFAFTGNKFEFRAVGSNQNCAWANTVLNLIVAEALDEICSDLESKTKSNKNFNVVLQKILQGIVKKHKRIIFSGDNYSKSWTSEASKRGLLNLKTTTEALKVLKEKKAVSLFQKHAVLSKVELESRYEIYREQYEKIIKIEGTCMLTMAKTMIIPAAVRYIGQLAYAVNNAKKCAKGLNKLKILLNEISAHVERVLATSEKLEKNINKNLVKESIDSMEILRESVDALEGLLPENIWPLPSYAKMMSLM
ncbi:MAG: glutamine synthetase III [Candidatus Omnitrophota bacterium]